MIFTTVGTAHLPFNRLVQAIDELAGRSSERFIMQIGLSTYDPQHAEWFRFAEPQRISKLIVQAEVVVTHGGCGILSECIRARKKIVACPRSMTYNEAVNPQHELVAYLEKHKVLMALEDVAMLEVTIEKAKCMEVVEMVFESSIPQLVKAFVRKQFI